MKIGINATYLSNDQKTGVENYATSAINSLIQDKSHQFYLYDRTKKNHSIQKHIVSCSLPLARGWHTLALPYLLAKYPVDILFEPGYGIPPFSKTRTVVVVHDLAYKHFPEAYSQKERLCFDKIFKNIERKASGIVFTSINTKNDFENFFSSSTSCKRVIYQGSTENIFNNLVRDHNFSLPPYKYILSVGRLEERKNTFALVKAYLSLRQKYNTFNHKLLLIGKPGYGYEKIEREIISNRKYRDDIILTGFVSDSELKNYYINADLFVYPSLYEGFGIPILDAFRSGTAVICSNSSSLPEVAGDCALFCDPLDYNDIADKILKLLSDPKLNEKLIESGRKRAQLFTWKQHTKQLLDLFKEVYENCTST